MDAQDFHQLQQIAEAEMQEKMQESTSGSDDDSFANEELDQEIELLESDPNPAEILPSKTRGKKIDFKAAELRMAEEIKASNSKHGLDPMEIEEADEEYIVPEE